MQPHPIAPSSSSAIPPMSPRSLDDPSLIAQGRSADQAAQEVAGRALGEKALPGHERTDARPSSNKKIRVNLPSEQEITEAFERGPQAQKQFLETCIHEGRGLNTVFSCGSFRGANLLWIAANWGHWNCFDRMLEHAGENPNINATPLEGPDRGATVLWLAASHQKWDVVNLLLKKFPEANINARRVRDYGKTVLFMAAEAKQWDCVRQMLKLRTHTANLNFSGSFHSSTVSVSYLMEYSQCSDLRALCVFYEKPFGKSEFDGSSLYCDKTRSAIQKAIRCFFGSVAKEKDAVFDRLDHHLRYILCKNAILSMSNEPSLASYPQVDKWLKETIHQYLVRKSARRLEIIPRLGFRNWRHHQRMDKLPQFTGQQKKDIPDMLAETVKPFVKKHNIELVRENRRAIIDAIGKSEELRKPAIEHALNVAFGKI